MQQTTQPTRPTRREKVGVIDVGGGLRSAYSTGVLDYRLDHGPVDHDTAVAELHRWYDERNARQTSA